MVRHYFDYAASTPVDFMVEKAMKPYWSRVFGNPGSLHWFGQEASAAVFKARDTIAKLLGCNYREIIFTGSATEANNLALRGTIAELRRRYADSRGKIFSVSQREVRDVLRPKLIVSAVEHESVLETARDLEREGVEVVYLPVSKEGIIDLKKLKASLDERTILVSVMYANNEIGTIQPIAEIAKIVSDFRNPKPETRNPKQIHKSKIQNVSNFDIRALNFRTAYPLFHCDAVQAFNYLDCNVKDLGVDLMTLSSQKIYGPKGIGLLYQRSAFSVQRTGENKKKLNTLIANCYTLAPIITGGGQEYGLRSGTENVPAIVGFAKAVELISNSCELENKRLQKLQAYFLKQIKKLLPRVQLNGDSKNRLPNNLNLYFPKSSAQDLIIKLDLAGFAVSPGAACSARTCKPSHVLKALGYSDERATSSLRITFGRPTTKDEIDKLCGGFKKILKIRREK